MNGLKWFFADNFGGREYGFADGGVETFSGDHLRYLAREIGQNSLDARSSQDKPVRIEFQRLELDRSAIPDVDGLQLALERSRRSWHDFDEYVRFFDAAIELLRAPKLTVLKISDYNTTGVSGDDKDRTGHWYNLVRSAGSTAKTGSAGGSFGLGKNAPFAASRLRTVLYSTMTQDGDHAFQGVALLVSHETEDGKGKQATGFLGVDGGASVRNVSMIPTAFRRSEPGLDIFSLAYDLGDDWQDALTESVLNNFWPAIEFGDLEVTIDSLTIDSGNLAELMQEYALREDFRAHHYYRAYKKPTLRVSDTLKHLREVELFLDTEGDNLPRKIAMVRKTGMVIYEQSRMRSLVPYCGVFLCRNQTGNQLLRRMEPPRHDAWDEHRPTRNASRHIRNEFMKFIREGLQKLAPVEETSTTEIPDLHKYLHDMFDVPETPFLGTSKKGESGFGQRAVRVRKRSVAPVLTVPRGGQNPGVPDQEGGPIRNGRGEGGGGTGGPGVGGSNIRAAREEGPDAKKRLGKSLAVEHRAMMLDADGSSYRLIVSCRDSSVDDVLLNIFVVGDDSRADGEGYLRSVRTRDGENLPIRKDGLVGPVSLGSDGYIELLVEMARPMRVAMGVRAREA